MQFCEGFVKEWFDKQHNNTSALYREGFGEGRRRHAKLKRSGYLRRVLQNIPLCAFVSLAACQWRREDDVDRNLGERSPTYSSKYKVTPKYGCLHNLLGVVPRASMNNALSTAKLAVREGRRGELRDGGPCQGPLSISCLLAVARLITW